MQIGDEHLSEHPRITAYISAYV